MLVSIPSATNKLSGALGNNYESNFPKIALNFLVKIQVYILIKTLTIIHPDY